MYLFIYLSIQYGHVHNLQLILSSGGTVVCVGVEVWDVKFLLVVKMGFVKNENIYF